jgi:hypothetical protein
MRMDGAEILARRPDFPARLLDRSGDGADRCEDVGLDGVHEVGVAANRLGRRFRASGGRRGSRRPRLRRNRRVGEAAERRDGAKRSHAEGWEVRAPANWRNTLNGV